MSRRLFNSNIPAYVGVYNSLYSDIINNVYLEEEQLPSELALAEKYGVSRNTLRQALAVLREDGLIVKSQGKGTVVARRVDGAPSGKICNPMTSMCTKEIDDAEIHYNFAPPTDIARFKLGLDTSDLVLACTNIYKSKGQALGYSFIQIPTNCFGELDVDLTQPQAIETLVEQTIYDAAAKAMMDIKVVFSNEMEAELLSVAEGLPLLLIQCILYSANHQPFARCKFYFIEENYNIQFQL